MDLVQLGDTLDQVHEDGTVEPWKLQILVLINAGVDSVGRNRQLPRLYERPHRVANLRVFLGEKDVPGLWDVVNGVGFPLTVSSGIPHNGSNLTALSWKVYDSVSVPDTPQLRHLKIWVRPSNMDEFTAYLGKIGTQLESLFCVFGLRMAGDYIDIWRLCPNLKYLRIRGHPEPVMPPTPGHPIELLSIFHFGQLICGPYTCSLCGKEHRLSHLKTPIETLARAGIKVLLLERGWNTWASMQRSYPREYSHLWDVDLCLHRATRRHGMKLEDLCGRTFEDWVIENVECWSGTRKRMKVSRSGAFF